jgi:hypothetical protein
MKIFLRIRLIILSMLLLIACNDNQNNIINQTDPLQPHYTQDLSLHELVDSVGVFHNSGVDYLYANWDSTWDLQVLNDYFEVTYLSHQYVESKAGIFQFDSALIISTFDAWNSPDFIYKTQQLFSELKNLNITDSICCLQDIDIIDSLNNYLFNFESSGIEEQDYLYLNNYINSLIDKWYSVNWDSIEANTLYFYPGTFSKSCLNLTLSSVNYIHNFIPNNNIKKNKIQYIQIIIAVVIADAAGFEFGYANAVVNDIISGYAKDPKNSDEFVSGDRFTYYSKCGLETSISWSTGTIIGKAL